MEDKELKVDKISCSCKEKTKVNEDILHDVDCTCDIEGRYDGKPVKGKVNLSASTFIDR